MKKVVFNRNFGGFSISKECAQWLADRGNKECIELLKRRYGVEDSEFYGYIEWTPRHDALLVMAVEELGPSLAGGDGCELDVHELVGRRYYIEEYDGSESVIEPHTIPWIEV